MPALYSTTDYLAALKALLPPGRAWAAEPGSAHEQVLESIALGLSRSDGAAADLLADGFPATTDALLPEWEATTGLPDPCAGASPTLQQRQAQVVARLANSGGQSAAYFIAFAARLGFDITVTEYAPFRAGQSRVGSPLGAAASSHTWAITAPLNNVTPFRAGRSAVGEPLQAFGNAVLECELRAVAPAHTTLIFTYA